MENRKKMHQLAILLNFMILVSTTCLFRITIKSNVFICDSNAKVNNDLDTDLIMLNLNTLNIILFLPLCDIFIHKNCKAIQLYNVKVASTCLITHKIK